MNILYLFTTKECPFCDLLKKMMLEEKVSFFNLDIEENEELYLPIIEKTGLDFIPALEIKNTETNESKYFIPERDFKTLDQCILLIKENIKTL